MSYHPSIFIVYFLIVQLVIINLKVSHISCTCVNEKDIFVTSIFKQGELNMLKKLISASLIFMAILFCFVACDDSSSSKKPSFDAKSTPLTLENYGDTDMTVTVSITGFSLEEVKLKYSIDNEDAIEITETDSLIIVGAGKKISFYGDRTKNSSASTKYFTIDCSTDCYIYGNVMSLITSTDFATNKSLEGHDYAFLNLFLDNYNIKNHESKKLVLPATKLSALCYSQMFYGCVGLTKAPELPATNLSFFCYKGMFSNCTGLVSAPSLPANELFAGCYQNMFTGCSALTEAPELPARRLAIHCYASMFQGCTNLASVTCHATTTDTEATKSWLQYVSPDGTFTKAQDASFWETGENGIPTAWTIKTM